MLHANHDFLVTQQYCMPLIQDPEVGKTHAGLLVVHLFFLKTLNRERH